MDKLKRALLVVKSSPTLTTWYSRLPLVINVLVVLPLVLRYFDVSDVALYYLVGSFVRFQDIADFGFGFSYSRYYSYAFAGAKSLLTKEINRNQADDPRFDLIADLYRSNKRDYLFIAIIFVLVFGGFASFQMRHYLEDEVVCFTWAVFVLSLGFKIRYKFVESFIVGIQEIALLRLVTGHLAVAQVLILFIVLFTTRDVCAGIWVNTVFFWVIVFRNFLLSRRIMKEKGIDISVGVDLDKPVRKELMSVAFKSGWGNLVTTGLYTTSGFIFTPILAELELAVLLFSNKILDVIRDFSRAPFYSKLPELNTLFVRDQKRLQEKAKLYGDRSVVIYVFGILGFLFLKDFLLSVVGGDFKFIPHEYWIFLSSVFFLERIGSLSIQLYSVSNKVKYHLINTVYFAVSIAILWTFIGEGMYSYPFSLMVGLVLVYLPSSLVLLNREYGWNLLSFFAYPAIMFVIFLILSIGYVQVI